MQRNDVWGTLLQVIGELDKDGVDPRELDSNSRLSQDLGLSSVDSIHLMISLEDAFKKPLGLETLVIRNGQYAQDLALGTLCDHVCEQLGVGV
jgi:acyl carrier protein